MAIVANTYQTYQAVGRREDLSNTIYNIAPSDTPFMSMIGKAKATNTLAEWQSDSLDAAAANAVIDGDDYAYTAVTPTVRLGNYTQISRKTVIVSGSQQASNNAGRDSEMAYQLAKSSKSLKKDMELALTGKVAKSAGSASAARTLGGMETWLTSNVSRGAGSPAGSGAGLGAAPVDAATKRALTEALLKTVIQSCYSSGGDPSTVMVGPVNKGKISAFDGRSTARQMIAKDAIQGGAHLYSSDFGELKIIPSRLSREQSCFVLDPEYWKVAYFRDFKQEEVAKTGDATKRALLVEYTLISANEAASGIVADCTIT
jgi:hypothetical protein